MFDHLILDRLMETDLSWLDDIWYDLDLDIWYGLYSLSDKVNWPEEGF